MYTYVCVYTYIMYIYIEGQTLRYFGVVCVCVCVCVCVHTHIQIHTHTHTHLINWRASDLRKSETGAQVAGFEVYQLCRCSHALHRRNPFYSSAACPGRSGSDSLHLRAPQVNFKLACRDREQYWSRV